MKKTLILIILAIFTAIPSASIFAYSTNYRYENKPFDINTQLYDFNARQYNPNIGQFTQPDTYLEELLLKGAGGNDPKLQELLASPQKLNQRSFKDNNPVNYTDPTGKQAELIIPAIPYIFEGATLALGSWFTWEAGQSAGYALENDPFKSQLHANNSFFILGLVGAVADVALVALDLFAPLTNKITQKIDNNKMAPSSSEFNIKIQEGMKKAELESQLKGWEAEPATNGIVYKNQQTGYKIRISQDENGTYYTRIQNKYGNYLTADGKYLDKLGKNESRDLTHIILSD